MVFDLRRLRLAEQLAAAGGVLLFIFMFVFDWYGVGAFGANAWDVHTILRWLFLLTVVLALGMALLKATDKQVQLPVSASLILGAIAGFTTLCLIWRMLVDNPGPDAIVDVKVGAWLGLLCLLAIDAGAFLALQEEGISMPGASSAAAPAPAPAPAAPPAPAAQTPPPEAPSETSP